MIVATYRPAWEDGGRRVLGPDEDVATLAVAAGLDALEGPVGRVVLCTREPDYLLGNAPSVILAGLGLPDETPFEERLGGGPAVLDAIGAAAPGTLVIGVDAGAGGAVLVDGSPSSLERRSAPLPMSVVAAGGEAQLYEDPRLLRERGWAPSVGGFDLDSGRPTVISGAKLKDAVKLGADRTLQASVTTLGAAGAIEAIAAAVQSADGAHVVSLENGSAVALHLEATGVRVTHRERAAVPFKASPSTESPMILALPAYDRAFASKLRLLGQRCACGALHYPHRTLCPHCGEVGKGSPEPLPRTGHVHSISTVHMPVPGKQTPYSIAVIDLGELRVLAPVTDSVPGSTEIDVPGRLVLRLVAVREGVRDYGYAFQPDITA